MPPDRGVDGRRKRARARRRGVRSLRLVSDRISADDVAKVARLARLDLTDEELDRATAQLGDMLDHFADIDELDLADVEPMTQPYPLTQRVARRRRGAVARPRRGARRRARRSRTAGSGCRRSSGCPQRTMMAAEPQPARRDRRRRPRRRAPRRRRGRGAPGRDRRPRGRDPRLQPRARRRGPAAAAAVDAAVAAGDDPGPLAGVPVALKDNMCTRGHPDDLLVADPRGLAAARTTPPSSPGSPPPGP